jgi:hypothetical protein
VALCLIRVKLHECDANLIDWDGGYILHDMAARCGKKKGEGCMQLLQKLEAGF